MRIFKNFVEARGEIARDLKEMGVKVRGKSMQDKEGDFPTLELDNYGYTVTHPSRLDLLPTMPWCEVEWQDRLNAIMGNVSPLGTSWLERSDRHMDWSRFIEYNGRPLPMYTTLDKIRELEPEAAGDPIRLAYSYGERLALNDQVLKVVRELRRNGPSRQLFVSMWDPNHDPDRIGNRRVPCSLGWHFMKRDGKVNMTYIMRSCDFVTHWQNDVWLALKLLDLICHMTKNERGRFSQVIFSFHVYEKDVADVF